MRTHSLNFGQLWLSAILFVLACAFPFPAAAQDRLTTWGYGVRGGVSADPKQVIVGGHVESPELSAQGRLFFRPAVELGFGSDETDLTFNVDIVYQAAFPGSPWSLLFGAGPVIAYEKDTSECDSTFADFCNFSETRGGFSAVVGMRHSGGLSIELRASDRGHSFAALVGYTIRK